MQHIVNFRQHIGAETEMHGAVVNQIKTFSRGVAASSDSLEEDNTIDTTRTGAVVPACGGRGGGRVPAVWIPAAPL